MNKQEYIEHYNKKTNQALNRNLKAYGIDEVYIYHICIKDRLKYEIDNIVDLLNFQDKAEAYIYNIEKGDKIIINKYGIPETVIVTKINHSRKDKNKISSLTVKTGYGEYKHEIKDIVYNDIRFEDITDVCRHFYRYFFFNEYTIENANKILAIIRRI